MHYMKHVGQATFNWTSLLPFYDLGQHKYMCIIIFQTQLEFKQNVVENKWIERENLWKNHMSASIKLNPISVVPISW